MGVELGRQSLPELQAQEAQGQARADIAAVRKPPGRFKPPASSMPAPDRSPREGYEGVFTMGEFAAGSGSFVRYAKALGEGFECHFKWVAEAVPELEEMAAAEAGPHAIRHGDVLDTHPRDVGDVFMLLGGPECQPFSKAGYQRGLADERARTLWWVLWCLAERQFPSAFVENVKALITMRNGAEWALVQAVAQGIGYCVQPVRDDPLRLGIPHSRRRVFVFFLREDLAAKWGMPALFPPPESRPMIPLEHFLLPADSVEVQEEFRAFDLKLLDSGLEASFRPKIWPDDGKREPHCAWTCGRGGLGQRAYTRAVPALKVHDSQM